MSETDWRKVVAALDEILASPTADQQELARKLGIQLTSTEPAPVVSSLLRTQLQQQLDLPQPRAFSGDEYAYLKRLAAQAEISVPAEDQLLNRDHLDAWIIVGRAKRSILHLKRLRPEVGDIAVTEDRRNDGSHHGRISSLSLSGRLNYRGGMGKGAWPHMVQRIVKATDNDWADRDLDAREDVEAARRNPELVTRADEARLERWRTSRRPSLAAREALSDALATATNERPMQVVLQEHPSLLAHMISGNHGTWVIPQVQFGNHYMADFLIAGSTSAGLRWTLIEIESPTKKFLIKNGEPSETLRHAIHQIEDWREWLASNLFSARAARDEGGLGLPGITADARALIIMGREDAEDHAKKIRDRVYRTNRIEVRSYDWLLRATNDGHRLGWGVLDRESSDDENPLWA